MSHDLKQAAATIIAAHIDPVSGANLAESGMVSALVEKDRNLQVTLEIDPKHASDLEPLRQKLEAALKSIEGCLSATVVMTAHAQKPQGQQQAPQRDDKGKISGGRHIKSIIAVASGKGGVGKSTTSVNLALALSKQGKKVGLLDADIYGPSVPRMMQLSGKPVSTGKMLEPKENYGIRTMSIGYLVEEDTPMIWRGPMVMSALEQMIHDVEWGELDILVVDMPPGTGDAQLTMAQRVPLTGAVIVSTPQDIALLDVKRGVAMFEKTNVPILGVVENMSYFHCPHCDGRTDIFGHAGAENLTSDLNCDFLGRIPLHINIRTTSDGGEPITVSDPESPEAQAYHDIAERVLDQVALVTGESARKAPKIVMM